MTKYFIIIICPNYPLKYLACRLQSTSRRYRLTKLQIPSHLWLSHCIRRRLMFGLPSLQRSLSHLSSLGLALLMVIAIWTSYGTIQCLTWKVTIYAQKQFTNMMVLRRISRVKFNDSSKTPLVKKNWLVASIFTHGLSDLQNFIKWIFGLLVGCINGFTLKNCNKRFLDGFSHKNIWIITCKKVCQLPTTGNEYFSRWRPRWPPNP